MNEQSFGAMETREEVPSLEVEEVKVDEQRQVTPFEIAFHRFISKNEKKIEEITQQLVGRFLEIGYQAVEIAYKNKAQKDS